MATYPITAGPSPHIIPISHPAQDPRVDRLLNRALSCQAIRELYEKARSIAWDSSQVDLSIKFVDHGHIGVFVFEEQTIYLRNELLEDRALSVFTFELTNVIHQACVLEELGKIEGEQIGCEEFTKEIEKIEWEGTLLHSKIMKIAIREMGWSPDLDIFDYRNYVDFESHWHSITRFSPHAQNLRDQYADRTGNETIHPGVGAKFESAKYLVTHLTPRDLPTMLAASIPGLALGMLIATPGAAAVMALAGATGAIAQKALRPFIQSRARLAANITAISGTLALSLGSLGIPFSIAPIIAGPFFGGAAGSATALVMDNRKIISCLY